MIPRRALPILVALLLLEACGKQEPSPDLRAVPVEASLRDRGAPDLASLGACASWAQWQSQSGSAKIICRHTCAALTLECSTDGVAVCECRRTSSGDGASAVTSLKCGSPAATDPCQAALLSGCCLGLGAR